MSTFHRLLQQLAEEHDRELADVQTRATAGLHAPCCSQIPLPGKAESVEEILEEPVEGSSSTGSRKEEAVVARQFAERCGRAPACKSGSQGALSQRPSLQQAGLCLQPIWQMDLEELNVANLEQVSPWAQAGDASEVRGVQDPRVATPFQVKTPLHSLHRLKSIGLPLRTLWDCLGVACILFDLAWIPVQICFAVQSEEGVEWALRLFWSADLLLKLKESVASSVEGQHFFAAAKSRGLVFDMVIVALDWGPVVVSATEGAAPGVIGLLRVGKVPRILRILRVLRLAWMMKLERFFLALRDHVIASNESVSLLLGVLQNMVCLLLLCHLCSCIWFLVGTGDSDEHWVFYYGLHEEPLLVQYLWSFHWVASQWTPAPMEVLPRNDRERAFTTVLVVGGVMVFSTFMGAITASMTRLRNLSGQELSQSFLLRHFLHENRISRSLTVRICRYADLALERQQKRIEQESVRHLRLLSSPLHSELQKEIYLPHLQRHAFFAGYMDWDAAAMGRLCLLALGREFFAKGDVLFSLGSTVPRMYCVVGGTFIYQRRRGLTLPRGQTRPKRTVRVGSGIWCCEAALWLQWHNVGSMHALTEGEVVQVDAEKFRDVTQRCGGVFSRSALYAQSFSRNVLLDKNGLAWDLPSDMMYNDFKPMNSKHSFIFRRGDAVDADVAEAEWLALHASEESDDESKSRGTVWSSYPPDSEMSASEEEGVRKVHL